MEPWEESRGVVAGGFQDVVGWRRSLATWPRRIRMAHAVRTRELLRESPLLHRRAAEFLAYDELEAAAIRTKGLFGRSRKEAAA